MKIINGKKSVSIRNNGKSVDAFATHVNDALVAKYIFDKSIYENLIPDFNAEFTDYKIKDTINGNIVIRSIRSKDLPTMVKFNNEGATSLLEVSYINFYNIYDAYGMFAGCS